MLFALFVTMFPPPARAIVVLPPSVCENRLIDAGAFTYERLIAVALAVTRGDQISAPDSAFFEGVRRYYAALHKRPLHYHEVALELLRTDRPRSDKLLLAIQGYAHEQTLPPPPPPPVDREYRGASRPRCFTGHMRVATPRGPHPIGLLRVGDAVYSYDLANRRVVISLVTAVRHTPDRTFGRLLDHAVPIEVTGEHRFYAGDARFDEIARMDPHANLFGVTGEPGEDARLDLSPRRRGIYQPVRKLATVTEISLGDGPHNYFVEGILVHNVKDAM